MTVAYSKTASAHVYQGVECYSESLRTPVHSDVTLLAVRGEIDASNFDELESGLRRCVGTPRPVIVDLSQVPFLGVAGLRALCDFDERRRADGRRWVLVMCPMLRRLLDTVLGDHRIPVARSVGDALQQLHRSATVGATR